MAQVIVRHLEAEVQAGLQQQAALHGWTIEEEVHHILRNAVKPHAPLGLGSRIAQRFVGLGLVEPLPELRQPVGTPMGFDK
jgi:antitoxin FitA